MRQDNPGKWVIVVELEGQQQFFVRLYRSTTDVRTHYEYTWYIAEARQFYSETIAREVFNILHEGLNHTPKLTLARIIEHTGYSLEPVTVYPEDHK